MEELNEAHAALRQTTREKAVGGEGTGLAGVVTVKLEGARGLFGKIDQVGHGRLHPVRHFVLGDARRDFGIAEFIQFQAIELAQIIDEPAAIVGREAGRVGQVQHRVA